MDLTLYILIALLIYAVYRCAVWQREYVAAKRFIGVQKRIIAEKDVEIAVRQEMIEIFERRRDMAAAGEVKTFKISNEKYWLN
jgi:hypothetical protein